MSESIPKDFPPGKEHLTAREQRQLQKMQSLLRSPAPLLFLRSLPMAFLHLAIIVLLMLTASQFVQEGAEVGKMIGGRFTQIDGTIAGFVQTFIGIMLALAVLQVLVYMGLLLAQRSLYRTFLNAHLKATQANQAPVAETSKPV